MPRSTLNEGKEDGNRGRKEQEGEGILDDHGFPPRLGVSVPMKQELAEQNAEQKRNPKGLAVKVPQSSP